jgi:hypothetical protein
VKERMRQKIGGTFDSEFEVTVFTFSEDAVSVQVAT